MAAALMNKAITIDLKKIIQPRIDAHSREIKDKPFGVSSGTSEKDIIGGDRYPELLKGMENRYIGRNS